VTEGLAQFSLPLGSREFVRAGVEERVAEQRKLTDAIAALPLSALQTQLLLLRLCAGPRANYGLRALFLEAGALLAAAVDADAAAVLRRLLVDGRDEPADAANMLDRAAMPPAMGGLGIGGRTRVVAAAALTSWTDSLRAGKKHSPALRELGYWLGGGSEEEGEHMEDSPSATAPPLVSVTAGGVGAPAPPPPSPAPPAAAAAATRRGVSGVGSRTAHPTLGASSNPRGRRRPRVAAHAATTGCAGLAAAGFSFAGGRQILDARSPDPGASPASAALFAGTARAQRPPPAVAARLPSLAPPPLSSAAMPESAAGGSTGATPVVWLGENDEPFVFAPLPASSAAPPPPPPSTPPSTQRARAPTLEEVVLRDDLLCLRDAVAASFVAPATGAMWVPPSRLTHLAPRSSGPAGGSADLLAGETPAFPPPLPRGAAATPSRTATGQNCPAPPVAPSWGDLLGKGEGVLWSQRDLSIPAHAAARARLFEGLPLEQRAGFAASHGHGAAAWLSALPTPGVTGTAVHGEAMRAATRVWLGGPPMAGLRGRVCSCGLAVGAAGSHFFGTCAVQRGRHKRLHNHVVLLLAAALRNSGMWGEVEVERGLDGNRLHLRPDLEATRLSSGVRTWGDVSFASPSADPFPARVARDPLRAVAAEAREAWKVGKYTSSLFVSTPPHALTPLVWESGGRMGPLTGSFLRDAMDTPGGSTARQSFMTAVSVAVWRANARAAMDGFRDGFVVGDPSGPGTEGPSGPCGNSARVGD